MTVAHAGRMSLYQPFLVKIHVCPVEAVFEIFSEPHRRLQHGVKVSLLSCQLQCGCNCWISKREDFRVVFQSQIFLRNSSPPVFVFGLDLLEVSDQLLGDALFEKLDGLRSYEGAARNFPPIIERWLEVDVNKLLS